MNVQSNKSYIFEKKSFLKCQHNKSLWDSFESIFITAMNVFQGAISSSTLSSQL